MGYDASAAHQVGYRLGHIGIRWLLSAPTGSSEMKVVADAIREGAQGYLKTQCVIVPTVGLSTTIVHR